MMGPNAGSKDNELAPLDAEKAPLVTPSGAYGSLNDDEATEPVKTSDGKSTSRKRLEDRILMKTQTSFIEDAAYFRDGSIPHSLVLALVIGAVCGIAAYVYYTILFWLLEFVWHTLPEMVVVDKWPEWAYVLWIPLVGFTMALGVGLTVVYMGEPGDLPYTVKCVHEQAYVAMSHVMPMVRWFLILCRDFTLLSFDAANIFS